MKITLINPPSVFLEDQKSIYPLGILYAAAHLKRLGNEVSILDLAGKNIDEIRTLISEDTSDITGVTGTSAHYSFFKEVRNLLMGRQLIIGGPHASIDHKSLIDIGYDLVCSGDIENLITLKSPFNRPITVFPQPLFDLEDLHAIDRSLLKGYHGPVPIMATRGCISNCRFCARPAGSYRLRPVNDVIKEIESIESKKVIFYDDTLTFDRNWINLLSSELLERKIDKDFRCSTRVDCIDDNLLENMVKAGFTELCFGFESGDDRILNILNKKSTSKMNSEAVKMCHNHGLKVKGYFMLGNPGETKESILKTHKWIQDNKPDDLGIYMFHPLPGCDIWNNPGKYDLKFSKDMDSLFYGGKRTELTSVVSTSALSSDEITNYYRKFLNDFNL